MANLPAMTGKEVVETFKRAGFSVVNVKGSHHNMKKPNHRYRLSIPVHAGKNIGKGLLLAQIDKAGLTVEQFIGYIK